MFKLIKLKPVFFWLFLLSQVILSACTTSSNSSVYSSENRDYLALNPVTLQSGPMTSIPRASSVEIWLQSAPNLSVELLVSLKDTAVENGLRWQGTTADDGILIADIDGLEAESEYRYQVILDGKKIPGNYYFKTLPKSYFPIVHDVSFLFGSCSWWQEDSYPLIETMAKHPADFMLWLGDNMYMDPWDYDRAAGIKKKYTNVRKHKSLNQLLQSKGQVAAWDDHDYGRNDATGDWKLKEVALETFSRFWVNPSYGTPEIPGTQTQFRISDVDFILLDGRSNRDHLKLEEPRRFFGDDQIRWLKNTLLNSRAKLKLIISGSQFLNPLNTYEGWNQYPREMQGFMDWLEDQKIPGILFISGDRHFTEMIKIERKEGYPLYDITCSPMTSIVLGGPEGEEKNNPYRVEDTLVVDHNYCEMKITGTEDNRSLSITSFNTEGIPFWTKSLSFSELGL